MDIVHIHIIIATNRNYGKWQKNVVMTFVRECAVESVIQNYVGQGVTEQMIEINDHIKIKKELLKGYTKQTKIETIMEVWKRANDVIETRGQFYYVDLLSILQEIKREAENESIITGHKRADENEQE